MTSLATSGRKQRHQGDLGFAGVAALLATLDSVRRRIVAHRLLRVAIFGLSAVLAAFSILRLTAALLGFAVPVSGGFGAVFAAGLLAMAIGTGAVLMTAPSRQVVSRFMDRVSGAEERISTAMDLIARAVRPTPVTRALLRDAEARAVTIDPARMVPLRLTKAVCVCLLLAALSIVVVLVPLPGFPTGAADAGVPAQISEPQRAGLSAELRDIAAILGEDAEERRDPYLQAVARELEQVSRDVGTGTLVERAEIERALERLQRHAVDGYRRLGETAGSARDLSGLIGAAVERIAAFDPSGGIERRPADLPASADAGQESADAAAAGVSERPDGTGSEEAPASGPVLSSNRPGDTGPTERLFAPDAPCQIDGEASCMTPRDTNYNRDLPLMQNAGSQSADGSPNAARRQEIDGGMLIGPARQSGSGESAEAGRGTQMLAGDAHDERTGIGTAGEMTLRSERLGVEGQRIQLDVAPEPETRELASGERVGAQGWRKLPETDVERMLLPPAAREVLARYFEVPQE